MKVLSISLQMELKKNESAVMVERNERMRLEAAVTNSTVKLVDLEER